MYASRCSILTIVLLAACGGASRGGSVSTAGGGAGGGPPIAADAPQGAFVARFPPGLTQYWCQWFEDSRYTAEKQFTPIEISAALVRVHATGSTARAGSGTEYPIDPGEAAYVLPHERDEEERSVVLGDGVLYLMTQAAGASEPAIDFICATKEEQRRIAAVDPDTHRARLRAYAEARRQAYLTSAGDLDIGDLDLGDVELPDDEEDAAPASRWTPEQAEQIARARTMRSFTFDASAREQGGHITVVVLATLADGSTMRIGTSNPIFDALFAIDHAGNETETMVTIYPLDEDGAKISGRSQYKEIGYTFEGGNYSLHCEGKPGAVGSEENTWQGGGLYYNGQRGEDGPDVTVEITTLSSSNPGALRFRLRCGDEEKVFNGSATTEVIVSTTGGRGGHAIPKGDGNASNGGNGGNGGDITVLVDPSVRRYNLRAGSNGGKGGAGSRNKSSTFGNGFAGNDGQEGHISERRQPVSIP